MKNENVFIEIAPNLFVRSWDDVETCFLRGDEKADYRHLHIYFKNGKDVIIRNQENIDIALANFRSVSSAPGLKEISPSVIHVHLGVL